VLAGGRLLCAAVLAMLDGWFDVSLGVVCCVLLCCTARGTQPVKFSTGQQCIQLHRCDDYFMMIFRVLFAVFAILVKLATAFTTAQVSCLSNNYL
jgi:hypothetical protein